MNINGSIAGPPVAQEMGVIPAAVSKLTAVQVVALIFSAGLMLATVLLGVQYMVRYRKYHIAQAEDHDSLADPSGTYNILFSFELLRIHITASCASLPLTTRASSNATLLSEVISLTRLKPTMKMRNKHSRLRESVECEQDTEQEVTLA